MTPNASLEDLLLIIGDQQVTIRLLQKEIERLKQEADGKRSGS